jgi:hypothetical protein
MFMIFLPGSPDPTGAIETRTDASVNEVSLDDPSPPAGGVFAPFPIEGKGDEF